MRNEDNHLSKKLGLKQHSTAYLLHSPDNYAKNLPFTTAIKSIEDIKTAQWLQAFYLTQIELNREVELIKQKLEKNGQLWLCWPKKVSSVKTDLTGDVVRLIGLNSGLVDVKIASIDDTWSGLKFVYRLKDR